MPALNSFVAVAFLLLGLSGPAAAMSSADDGGGPMLPQFKAGFMAMKAGDYPTAEAALRESVKQSPNHVDSWSLLGFVARKQGRMDEALKYYEEALALNKDFRPALNYLGHLYLETGQLEKANGMLARLDDVCFWGCPEFDDLKKAIADGKSGKY